MPVLEEFVDTQHLGQPRSCFWIPAEYQPRSPFAPQPRERHFPRSADRAVIPLPQVPAKIRRQPSPGDRSSASGRSGCLFLRCGYRGTSAPHCQRHPIRLGASPSSHPTSIAGGGSRSGLSAAWSSSISRCGPLQSCRSAASRTPGSGESCPNWVLASSSTRSYQRRTRGGTPLGAGGRSWAGLHAIDRSQHMRRYSTRFLGCQSTGAPDTRTSKRAPAQL